MKLKIVSDGTCYGTRLVNADTGEAVEGVQGIRWTCDIFDHSLAQAEVQFVALAAELQGDVVEVTDMGDPVRVYKKIP